MKQFSISMAIVDYIPVLFFTVAAIMLQRDLYSKMSKGAFALFAAGTIDIMFAGFSKATYKLVYCIIKVPKVAETIPQSCMRNFPIIADAVWYFPKPIYRM